MICPLEMMLSTLTNRDGLLTISSYLIGYDGTQGRNLFLKSVKNFLAQQFPRCSASSVRCRRYTIACSVAFPAIGNCLGSRRSVMPGRTLESVNTSIILAVWQVRVVEVETTESFFPGYSGFPLSPKTKI